MVKARWALPQPTPPPALPPAGKSIATASSAAKRELSFLIIEIDFHVVSPLLLTSVHRIKLRYTSKTSSRRGTCSISHFQSNRAVIGGIRTSCPILYRYYRLHSEVYARCSPGRLGGKSQLGPGSRYYGRGQTSPEPERQSVEN